MILILTQMYLGFFEWHSITTLKRNLKYRPLSIWKSDDTDCYSNVLGFFEWHSINTLKRNLKFRPLSIWKSDDTDCDSNVLGFFFLMTFNNNFKKECWIWDLLQFGRVMILIVTQMFLDFYYWGSFWFEFDDLY